VQEICVLKFLIDALMEKGNMVGQGDDGLMMQKTGKSVVECSQK